MQNGVDDIVVVRVVAAEIIAIEDKQPSVLPAGDQQVGMAGNSGRGGKKERPARAEVRVGGVHGCNVIRDEEVDDLLHAPAIGVLAGWRGGRVRLDFDDGFVVVGVGGQAVGADRGMPPVPLPLMK